MNQSLMVDQEKIDFNNYFCLFLDEKMEEDADAITSGSPSKRRDVYEDSHLFLCNPMVPVSPPKVSTGRTR